MAGFDKLGLVMIVVSDMKRSVAFYRDVLGLKLSFEDPHWSQFDIGGVVLGLHGEEEALKVADSRQQRCSFGFYVQGIENVFADLVVKGATPIMEPLEAEFGKLALVADPDGYNVQLCEIMAH